VNAPIRDDVPSFGRRPGDTPEPPASEDHDLNDIGLVRGAVPESVWTWRRRKRA
jgi:hypothetical protein